MVLVQWSYKISPVKKAEFPDAMFLFLPSVPSILSINFTFSVFKGKKMCLKGQIHKNP